MTVTNCCGVAVGASAVGCGVGLGRAMLSGDGLGLAAGTVGDGGAGTVEVAGDVVMASASSTLNTGWISQAAERHG